MQVESLITETANFEARQSLNFTILGQLFDLCRKRQQAILDQDLERRSNSSYSSNQNPRANDDLPFKKATEAEHDTYCNGMLVTNGVS